MKDVQVHINTITVSGIGKHIFARRHSAGKHGHAPSRTRGRKRFIMDSIVRICQHDKRKCCLSLSAQPAINSDFIEINHIPSLSSRLHKLISYSEPTKITISNSNDIACYRIRSTNVCGSISNGLNVTEL